MRECGLLATVALWLTLAVPAAMAAEFLTPAQAGADPAICPLTLRGPIVSGDTRRLTEALRVHRPTDLCLDSNGGSMMEGIQMMQALHAPGVHVRTHVRPGATCASACAIVFMGGSDQFRGSRVPARFIWPGGLLGDHAFASPAEDRVFTVDEQRERFRETREVVRWLTQFTEISVGPTQLITPWMHRRILETPAEDMFWVTTVADAVMAGISLAGTRSPDLMRFESWANICAHAFVSGHPSGQEVLMADEAGGAASAVDFVARNLVLGPSATELLATSGSIIVNLGLIAPSTRWGYACRGSISRAVQTEVSHELPGRHGPLLIEIFQRVIDSEFSPPGEVFPESGVAVRIEPWFAFPPAARIDSLR